MTLPFCVLARLARQVRAQLGLRVDDQLIADLDDHLLQVPVDLDGLF
jgi:hypothetical protein